MPAVRSAEPRLLVLDHLAWRVRTDPSVLEPTLADAVGRFFRSGKVAGAEGPEGPTHGDLAPWNVLDVDGGWALVDWEQGHRSGRAFFDVLHYIVQAYSLLGSPLVEDVIAGVRGSGRIGEALATYAHAAEVSVSGAEEALMAYLPVSRPEPTSSDPAARRAIARRDALLRRLGG